MDRTSRRESLEAQVASFPAKPGVYLFKDAKGRVLYVGTFSKTLSPAIRLGYLIVPPSLVAAFARVRLRC